MASEDLDEQRKMHQRNDAFFRGYFKQPPIARPFLEWKLPARLVAIYGLKELELAPNSYIDDQLRPYASDLLWKAKAMGPNGVVEGWFFTLWEHQKNPDAFSPLRCLRYLTGAWLDFVQSRERERGEKLPPAVAIVLYQGTGEWTQPTRFRQMVDYSPATEEDFGDLMPELELILVPLDQIPEEELPQTKLCFLGLTLMQAAARGEVVDWVRDKQAVLIEVLKEFGVDANFQMLLRYAVFSVSAEETPKLSAALTDLEQTSGTDMKTAYDVMFEEALEKGMEKGMEVGQRSVIHQMAAKGLSAGEIAELTEFSQQEVEQILANEATAEDSE